jgi:hypothetical protein
LPGSRLGVAVAIVALFSTFAFGLDRFQVGPAPSADWKNLARRVGQSAASHEPIVFAGSYVHEPLFDYIIMAHYMGSWKWQTIFLQDCPSDAVMRQLASRGKVWVIGNDPVSESRRFFPGWQPVIARGAVIGDSLWAVIPPAPENEKK